MPSVIGLHLGPEKMWKFHEISWLVHSLRFTQPPERCGSRQRNANLGGFGEICGGVSSVDLYTKENL